MDQRRPAPSNEAERRVIAGQKNENVSAVVDAHPAPRVVVGPAALLIGGLVDHGGDTASRQIDGSRRPGETAAGTVDGRPHQMNA
jgi:hypothetical protein